MDTEKTLTLRKPIKIGEEIWADLHLEEPTAGQIEKASAAETNIGMVISLISAVAKVPRAVAERLCQRDFKEASDFLNQFNEAAPASGATSSQS